MNKITINGTELTTGQATLVEASIMKTYLGMPKVSQLVLLEDYMDIVKLFKGNNPDLAKQNQLFRSTSDYGTKTNG